MRRYRVPGPDQRQEGGHGGIDIHPMYRKLVEKGYDVTVSHPKKTRYIAEAR